jgi:valyl-tRNA synthetase
MKNLDKNYNPSAFEERIYKQWTEQGLFTPKADENKKPFTIVLPPPNITGQLHIGHAQTFTYPDILIRWRRMQGYAALWLPGTDHASIATEAKVVEQMKAEGITKADIGREKFLERLWQWKDKYGGIITQQLRKMGFSLDWSRERFTMDEGCSKAVRKVFLDLYEQGKIYHGERIINWCPKCRTSISDIECEYEEEAGHFWHILYPFADENEEGGIRIATTRPETLLGDTAVAVNPNDARYTHLIGKAVKLPLTDRVIPIIADEYVDMAFGTGAVKITPAHDPNDFEVGNRHNLPLIHMMNSDATISSVGGKYAGTDRYAARKQMVADLDAAGLLIKVEDHAHNVGHCQRCGTIVEPTASKQWFVRMEELAKPAADAVREKKIAMIPSRFEGIYLNWMDNIRDWCISRQLWWGHRIPAYYCQNPYCKAEIVCDPAPEKCPHCGGAVVQDEDTLDTWFSSALWPFSTLGWTGEKEQTEDYKYFYPTDVMITAGDIIFFWVARMIFSGMAYTGKIPFHTVMYAGIVRDEQGRKMSKSLDNGVDPLDIIAEYGADALRFTLMTGTSPGNDQRWSEKKLLAARNFANKLWNAARYVLMNLPDGCEPSELKNNQLKPEDKWLLFELNQTIKDVTRLLEQFEIGVAADKISDFIRDIYCDWYVELSKPRIYSGDIAPLNILLSVLKQALLLLHPFMPFITEEIYQTLPGTAQSIMIEKWPETQDEWDYAAEHAEFNRVVEGIRALRSLRVQNDIRQNAKVDVEIETAYEELFTEAIPFFEKLGGAQSVRVLRSADSKGKAVAVTDSARIFLAADAKEEQARLKKEQIAVQKDIDFLSKKLNNPGFLAKAPEKQVQAERQKLDSSNEKMKKILDSLGEIEGD